MGESHDFMNLDWVQADIEKSLQQAQESLEAYLEDAVSMHLESSYDAVHQVHGSLQMAGIPGAVMLAEQVEALLKAMLNNEISEHDEACNALAQALVYLPAYLNRVRNDEQDSPALLHTVVNDVLRVLGKEPIDELLLFNPDIGEPRERASAEVKTRFDAVPQAELRKLRQVYQFALIGLIRKEDTRVNTARLSNVSARLQQVCQDAPINQLWEVATAFIESLLVDGTELNSKTLDVLRSLEREIKEFIRAGVFALDRQAHPELMKQMLYYVAKSSQSGPHIQSIHQAYGLDRYELGDAYAKKVSLLAGPDPETFRMVATALTEELERIKDSIDLYVRSSEKSSESLDGLMPGLKQISSTLVMLNLEAPRVVVQEQIDSLGDKLDSGAELPDTLLLQAAEALLFVEAELESLTGRVQGVDQGIPNALVGAAAEVVVAESLSSLRKAKDSIHEFLASNEDFNLLESVPNTLRSAYGGLAMLSQSIPAQLVLSASQYVEDDMLAQHKLPDEEAIEALAEVMASVEFCLEGVASHQPVNDAILARAKVQIAKLGYPVEQTDGIDSEEGNDGASVSELELPAGGYGEFDWGVANAEQPEAEQEIDETSIDVELSVDATDDTVELESVEFEDPEFSVSEDDSVEEESAIEEVDALDEEAGLELETSEPEEVSPVDEFETLQPEDVTEEPVAQDLSVEPTSEEPAVDEPSDVAVVAEEADVVEDDDDLIDDEILEIFTEEAQEVFAEIDAHWPAFAEDYNNTEALTESRRAFHTLKGSGRMVKADYISELAWSIENMLNRVIEGEVSPSPALCDLVNEVRPVLPTLLAHFEAKTQPEVDVEIWRARADSLAAGEMPEESLESVLDEESEDEVTETDDAAPDFETFVDEPVEAFSEVNDEIASKQEEPVDLSEMAEELDEDDSDRQLYELFVKESEQHLATVESFIQQVDAGTDSALVSDALYRALHTLKGSANMSALEAFANIASPLEMLVLTLMNSGQPANDEALSALRTGHTLMTQGLTQLPEHPHAEIAGSDEFTAELADLLVRCAESNDESGEVAVSAPQVFIQTYVDIICNVADNYENWRQQPEADSPVLSQVQSDIEVLLQAGQDSQLPEAMSLLSAMAVALGKVVDNEAVIDESGLAALDAGCEGLIGVFDQVAASEAVGDVQVLVDRLESDLNAAEVDSYDDSVVEGASSEEELPELESSDIDYPVQDTGEEYQSETGGEPAHEFVDIAPAFEAEEPDSELIEIFLEEADEILEQASSAKQRWIDDSTDGGALDELQRCLHTLKGGARMAGITAIGDLSHELESLYETVAEGRLSLSPQLYDMVHACDDRIMDMLGELRDQFRCNAANDLINRVQQFRETGELEQQVGYLSDAADNQGFVAEAGPLLEQLSVQINETAKADADHAQLHGAIQASLESFQNVAYQCTVNEAGDLCHIFLEVLSSLEPEELAEEQPQADLADWLERISTCFKEAQQAELEQSSETTEAEMPAAVAEQSTERKATQDNVRVSAGLLEQLVDLAGETSVSRSRVEQQVSRYGYAIDEVGVTIERLREQLRRLENETETQILFRQEREGPTHEGFDPLEMDRYSRMQELSRALMESVSDLLDLKETLRDQVRVTENLLLQQSRTNTELHEGLMKARMVPFSRLVPRLRRIVRQISGELNKSVDMQFKNAEAELDRSLLEHMTAPLEHMLRNALDHGIESVNQREAAGKSATGRVVLNLFRDGGDIVLELQDDGAGIDIERVRSKAIESGLMAADARLSDHEILQFIMHQGFSTAEQVTQISGRGVGLDVVHSEIRQLGGSISIDSELGKGTSFTVRLPFTVSITRALMVNVGEDAFALPLSSIEGVVRINPYELEEYYRESGPDFEYAGVKYDLHYLGDFLGRGQTHQVQSGVLPLPVILVRTSDHAIAVQVDSISGSREVVLKPLGPQFNNVPGMSGATILGDGRVVLILDMASMVREHLAKVGIEQAEEEDVQAAAPAPVADDHLRVMVVDDSVTVRKVASRLLERHGMEVVLAKDGVEAMTKLQEVVPSIMLLDIEMPRMDGFELASLVRHDDNLRDVPIIMISSRTGDKHQARAREIGVNQFMGKPFQEADLLEAIGELTGTEFESLEA